MNKQPSLILSPSPPLPSHPLSLGLCRAPCVSPRNIFLPSSLVPSLLALPLCLPPFASFFFSRFPFLLPLSLTHQLGVAAAWGLLPCRLSAVILIRCMRVNAPVCAHIHGCLQRTGCFWLPYNMATVPFFFGCRTVSPTPQPIFISTAIIIIVAPSFGLGRGRGCTAAEPMVRSWDGFGAHSGKQQLDERGGRGRED